MKEFETSKTEYLEPSFLGLKTSIKVVGGKIIETVKNTRYNVVVLLMKHPYFEHLKLNTFNMLVYWNGKPIDDNQLSRMATWMEATYDVRPSISLMYECVNQVAEDKKYNPLEEYFKGKKWDGTPRLATLLEDYFGVEPSEINRAYSLKFFVGAIRRALYSTVENPIKHDSVLVLFGRQGLRKSTSIELLAIKPEWFGDTPLDISSKDCILHINGKLLYEMKELAKLSKDKKLEKAFLDQKVDSLRLPYGRIMMDFPRKTSFIATTNTLDILNDATGSRRWWPVICGYDWDEHGNMTPWPKSKKIDIEGLRAVKEQIWLEAIHYAKQKDFIHYLTDLEEMGRENSRDAFTSLHPLTPTVKSILENLHEDGIHHFQIEEDIIPKMDIAVHQRDYKTRNVIESIIIELGYNKRRVRVPQSSGGTKPLWRWSRERIV